MSDLIVVRQINGAIVIAHGISSGIAASTPTGTGFRHVTADVEDGTVVAETGTGNVIRASELASYQPLDSDLTAIAALTTTAYGRSLLTTADAAALKTAVLAAFGLTGLTVGGSSITFTAAGGSIELPIG